MWQEQRVYVALKTVVSDKLDRRGLGRRKVWQLWRPHVWERRLRSLHTETLLVYIKSTTDIRPEMVREL